MSYDTVTLSAIHIHGYTLPGGDRGRGKEEVSLWEGAFALYMINK